MSLRRRYHRHVRHHHRFSIAVVLTMIAVAWIAVPAVARFVDTVGSYDPRAYEPKDVQRGEWIASNPSLYLVETLSWETVVKLVLFVFAALAWLAVSSSPGGGGSGPPPARERPSTRR
jgi:hypothetical protein